MTDLIRVTIACPAAHIDDANQLARCLGTGAADGATFGPAGHRDAQGRPYAVASGLVSPSVVAGASAPLIAPPWGADMEAANRAQARITVHDPEAFEVPFAAPERIAAVVGLDPPQALDLLGVARTEVGE